MCWSVGRGARDAEEDDGCCQAGGEGEAVCLGGSRNHGGRVGRGRGGRGDRVTGKIHSELEIVLGCGSEHMRMCEGDEKLQSSQVDVATHLRCWRVRTGVQWPANAG